MRLIFIFLLLMTAVFSTQAFAFQVQSCEVDVKGIEKYGIAHTMYQQNEFEMYPAKKTPNTFHGQILLGADYRLFASLTVLQGQLYLRLKVISGRGVHLDQRKVAPFSQQRERHFYQASYETPLVTLLKQKYQKEYRINVADYLAEGSFVVEYAKLKCLVKN